MAKTNSLKGTSKSGGMNVLFIHQNFPSQYLYFARFLAANPSNRVAAIGNAAHLRQRKPIPGVGYFGYSVPATASPEKTGMAVRNVMASLRDSGFNPDIIYAHPAWGEALGVRAVFPCTPFIVYAEFYSRADEPCASFDPEYPLPMPAAGAGNALLDTAFADADMLQTPTNYQFDMLPENVRNKTIVTHDGIDTDWFRPALRPSSFSIPAHVPAHPGNAPLPDSVPRRNHMVTLSADDEVITFINRTLEPLRGWHTFARAIPRIQELRPQAHVVIVGRTADGYGPPPADGGNWRDTLLREIRDTVDFSRIHFVGNLSTRAIRDLLRLSRAHVYLTAPFFVSYSPLEALACETPLIASNTAPILEMVEDGETGVVVDFFSPQQVAGAVDRLLSDKNFAARVGKAGRAMVIQRYDARRVALPLWKQAAVRLQDSKKGVAHAS